MKQIRLIMFCIFSAASLFADSLYVQDMEFRAAIYGEGNVLHLLPSGEWVELIVDRYGKVVDKIPRKKALATAEVKLAALVGESVFFKPNWLYAFTSEDLLQRKMIGRDFSVVDLVVLGDAVYVLTAGDGKTGAKIFKRPLAGGPLVQLNLSLKLQQGVSRVGGLQMIAVGDFIVVYQRDGRVFKIDPNVGTVTQINQNLGKAASIIARNGDEYIFVKSDNTINVQNIKTNAIVNHGAFFLGMYFDGYYFFKDSLNKIVKFRSLVSAFGTRQNLFEMDVLQSFFLNGKNLVLRNSGELAEVQLNAKGDILDYRVVHRVGDENPIIRARPFQNGLVAHMTTGEFRVIPSYERMDEFKIIGRNGWQIKDMAVIGNDIYLITPKGNLNKKNMDADTNVSIFSNNEFAKTTRIIAVNDHLVTLDSDGTIRKIAPNTKQIEQIALIPNADTIYPIEENSFAVVDSRRPFEKSVSVNVIDGTTKELRSREPRLVGNDRVSLFADVKNKFHAFVDVEKPKTPPQLKIVDTEITAAIPMENTTLLLKNDKRLMRAFVSRDGTIKVEQELGAFLDNMSLLKVNLFGNTGLVAYTAGKEIRVFDDVKQSLASRVIGQGWDLLDMAVIGDSVFILTPSRKIVKKDLVTGKMTEVFGDLEKKVLQDITKLIAVGNFLVGFSAQSGIVLKLDPATKKALAIPINKPFVDILSIDQELFVAVSNDVVQLKNINAVDGTDERAFEQGLAFRDKSIVRDSLGKIVVINGREDDAAQSFLQGALATDVWSIVYQIAAHSMYDGYLLTAPFIKDDTRSRDFELGWKNLQFRVPSHFAKNLPPSIIAKLKDEGIAEENTDIFVVVQSNSNLGETEDHEDATWLTTRVSLHTWAAPHANNEKGHYLNANFKVGIFEPEYNFVESEIPIGKLTDVAVSVHDNFFSPHNARIKLPPRSVPVAFWTIGIGNRAVDFDVKAPEKSAAVTLHYLMPETTFDTLFPGALEMVEVEHYLSSKFFDKGREGNSFFSKQLKQLLYGTF